MSTLTVLVQFPVRAVPTLSVLPTQPHSVLIAHARCSVRPHSIAHAQYIVCPQSAAYTQYIVRPQHIADARRLLQVRQLFPGQPSLSPNGAYVVPLQHPICEADEQRSGEALYSWILAAAGNR